MIENYSAQPEDVLIAQKISFILLLTSLLFTAQESFISSPVQPNVGKKLKLSYLRQSFFNKIIFIILIAE